MRATKLGKNAHPKTLLCPLKRGDGDRRRVFIFRAGCWKIWTLSKGKDEDQNAPFSVSTHHRHTGSGVKSEVAVVTTTTALGKNVCGVGSFE